LVEQKESFGLTSGRQALYKIKNIEFAAFFEGEINCRSIEMLFKVIKANNQWDERTPIKKKEVDDSINEFSHEEDNFEIRKISKALSSILATKKWQKELEVGYESGKPISLPKPLCKIDVLDIHDEMFDLRVRYKNTDFPLYIPREHINNVYSNNDIALLLDELLTITSIKSKRKRAKNDGNGTPNHSFRNIRFPMPNFILNKALLSAKKETLRKLEEIDSGRLSPADKATLDIWSQIIEQWVKS
jgi:hypothetical protein